MKRASVIGVIALLAGGATTAIANDSGETLVVTASNSVSNQLLVYNTAGALLQTISTKGKGGASGNSGGIAVRSGRLAVVNFGSQSVTIFERSGNGFVLRQLVSAISNPLSVALTRDHLYILGTTHVESHRIYEWGVNPSPDGAAALLQADGSAAQVGVAANQLVITEKSNVIETVALNGEGAVAGSASLVQGIPANVNTPFGLITRSDNAYVTIAHADEISLVRNGSVLTTTPTTSFTGPVQHAPCWLALVGPFLYASNSPSSSLSRYAVYEQKIVPDLDVAASLHGAPTDIASGEGLVAVIDGNGGVSHLSVFRVDEDGNLILHGAATIQSAANGVAVAGTGIDRD